MAIMTEVITNITVKITNMTDKTSENESSALPAAKRNKANDTMDSLLQDEACSMKSDIPSDWINPHKIYEP